MMSIILSDKLTRAMFNGKTLNNKFRRGWWKVADAKATDGCPEAITTLPNDAKVFWYNGCIGLWADTNKKEIYINQNASTDDLIKELRNVLMDANDITLEHTFIIDLGKATRAGAKRDLESLLSI